MKQLHIKPQYVYSAVTLKQFIITFLFRAVYVLSFKVTFKATRENID